MFLSFNSVLQGIVGYLFKIVNFSSTFRNYGNLSEFKFLQYVHSFWGKLFFTENRSCEKFGTFGRVVSGTCDNLQSNYSIQFYKAL